MKPLTPQERFYKHKRVQAEKSLSREQWIIKREKIDDQTKSPKKNESKEETQIRLITRNKWSLPLTKEEEEIFKEFKTEDLMVEMKYWTDSEFRDEIDKKPDKVLSENQKKLRERARKKIQDLIANPENYGKDDVKKDNPSSLNGYLIGERGGRYNLRLSKNGNLYRQYF